MNCEQCEEQVFELIEREAVDPAGVREILDRCPNCRVLFDEMKAALVAVDQLPLEDPPTRIDADILRAAMMRRGKVKPIRKRALQAPPWAMAAVALLAVGIGVWAIPRDTKLATENEVVAPVAESDQNVVAAPKPATAPAKLDEAMSAKAKPTSPLERARRAEPIAKTPMKPSVARRERAPAKRKARRSSARQLEAAGPPPTETVGVGAEAMDMAEAPAEEVGAADAARAEVSPAAEEGAKAEADDSELACKKTIGSFEERRRGDADFRPGPEQQLALGRCYAKLGDEKRARTWLERAAAHAKTRTRAQAALKELTTGGAR